MRTPHFAKQCLIEFKSGSIHPPQYSMFGEMPPERSVIFIVIIVLFVVAHYEMSVCLCLACQCNLAGSLDLQCDLTTGACNCRINIAGQNCDKCEENKYNIEAGCLGRSDAIICTDLYHT